MMMFYLPAILLSLAVLAVLIVSANRSSHQVNPVCKVQEQKTLIRIYRQQLTACPEQKSELDYQLYHALKALQAQEQPLSRRLPLWCYPALALVISAVFFLWKIHAGEPFYAWQQYIKPLQPALLRSQYLNDFSALAHENPLLYCQALQQRIDRRERRQLNALGYCYSAYKDYPAAAEVYARLYHLFPDDREAAFNYAQTSLFARPNQGMSAKTEHILQAQADTNPYAKILLAAGYTQSGKAAQAKILWAQLRHELTPEHPLYHLIPPTQLPATSAESPLITVTIAPDLLKNLPADARLFITAAEPGARIPLAARSLPPQARQTVQFSDRDSMTGRVFSDYKRLTYRAILSASAKVSGKRLAETETTTDTNTPLTLALP